MYKKLFDFQQSRGQGSGFTLGPAHQECSHIVGLLNNGSPKDEFLIRPWTFRNYPLKAILDYAENAAKHSAARFQFYDGGLRELFIALHLSRRLPDSQIIFNFHWAVQWRQLLTSSHLSARVLSKTLKRVLAKTGENLRICAESKKLSEFVAEALSIRCEPYPIFSTLAIHRKTPWSDRSVDVLILPQRASEIPFTIDLAKGLAANSRTSLVITRSDVWTKGLRLISSTLLPEDHDLPQVLHTPLSQEDYASMLMSGRVAVLPYDKPYFHWGSSGKFNEAICSGTFPFVPEQTAIAGQSPLPLGSHSYSAPQRADLLEKIERALSVGFPPELTGLTVEDFFSWVFDTKADSSGGRVTRGNATRNDIIFAHVVSVLWSLGQSMRRIFRRRQLAAWVRRSVLALLHHRRLGFQRV